MASGRGLVSRNTSYIVRGEDLYLLHPQGQEGDGEWAQSCSRSFSGPYPMKPQEEFWTLMLRGASWLVNTLTCWEGGCSESMGRGLRSSGLLPGPHPQCILSKYGSSPSSLSHSSEMWISWEPLKLQLIGPKGRWPGDPHSAAGV